MPCDREPDAARSDEQACARQRFLGTRTWKRRSRRTCTQFWTRNGVLSNESPGLCSHRDVPHSGPVVAPTGRLNGSTRGSLHVARLTGLVTEALFGSRTELPDQFKKQSCGQASLTM